MKFDFEYFFETLSIFNIH